jgi:hypothetical protein
MIEVLDLPGLVNEKVNYYFWRMKITLVNQEYSQLVVYDHFTECIRIDNKCYNWRNINGHNLYLNLYDQSVRKYPIDHEIIHNYSIMCMRVLSIFPKGYIHHPYRLNYSIRIFLNCPDHTSSKLSRSNFSKYSIYQNVR